VIIVSLIEAIVPEYKTPGTAQEKTLYVPTLPYNFNRVNIFFDGLYNFSDWRRSDKSFHFSSIFLDT
jgi:hypothetical protein